MPALARLASSLEPSATLALNSRIRELSQSGVKVWNFSVGEPDYPPPEGAITAAIHSLQHDPIRYGKAGGGAELKAALRAKLLRENSLDVTAQQIVCGVGAKQVLYHLMHALLDPGDEVLNHTPCWTSYVQQIRSTGARHIALPYLQDDEDHQPFAPEYIEKYASAQTKVFLLCSPNNPAGYVVKEEQLKVLGEYLLSKDWWIISDEIYEHITFDVPHRSLIQVVPELKERFIYVGGVSKSYAMTGWRMGYLAAPPEVSHVVRSLISHSSTCLPIFVEKAATWVIEQGPKVMSSSWQSLKAKRARALEILSGIPHLSVVPPEGAFYIFMDVRQILERSSAFSPGDTLSFCQHLLERCRVGLLAGEAFLCPGYVRLSYATSLEDLNEGLEILKKELLNLSSS